MEIARFRRRVGLDVGVEQVPHVGLKVLDVRFLAPLINCLAFHHMGAGRCIMAPSGHDHKRRHEFSQNP